MIPLFFTNLPVTLEYKISKLVERAIDTYGSEYYNTQGSYWKGDQLTLESLFPDYILREYKNYPDKVKLIPLIKNYLRWLFSIEYGYGAYIEWEKLRTCLFINEKLLQGYAETYFPDEDFSSDDLKDVLPNIKKFSIKVDSNYFNIKGTPNAIKYVLVELLGMPYNTTQVQTYSNFVIKIIGNVPEKYKPFLNRSVYPAGTTVIYESV